MPNIWLPRAPAHFRLRPTVSWHKADKQTTFLICDLLSLSQDVVIEQMNSSLFPPIGYYRITQQKAPSLFVKVIGVGSIEQQLFSDSVATFLAKYSVNTNKLVTSYPPCFSDDGKYGVLIYPMVNGRFAEFTEHDMTLIGSEIGKMHKALRSCPWKKEIEKQGIKRTQVLDDILYSLRAGTLKVNIPEGVARVLKSAEVLDYQLLTCEAQVIHGDLNYGNIMIQQDDKKAIIFDFEDTITAWFNPYTELAFVIERFTVTSDDYQSIRLSQALVNSYFQENNHENKSKFDLSSLLRGLSIKALLILTKASVHDVDVTESEWEKFLVLYEQQQKRSELFDRISEMVVTCEG